MKPSGFSLMELLLVIAIIGIISAVTLPNYLSYRKRTQQDQLTQQFVTNANSARFNAKRLGQCQGLKYVSSSSYQLLSYTTPNCTDTPTAVTYTLPATFTLAQTSTGDTVQFLPPYGTNYGTSTGAAPLSVTITNGTRVSKISVTNVMGRVIVQ
ncbi:prepilin-type N-terminal cleavage/methylation domain-containing protein [Deinococcus taeanensis]|uniref:pilus assembly FimT family protein n=1 Tax=Deinococcus taeanensis TaxID=2737050 RepID=UPI001CDD2C0B|nr:prepilin-type N-terminal cleavage/methylation domain-containing protein [Deinococcus taeanensis]UBV43562.1 prepilin-type N-terminal cleavage/methylation domain-containing protein [Deinococcus taeanensis]